MRKLIGPLVDFNYWANRRLLGTVETLPADAFTRELGREFSVPTLQGMLVHIMSAEQVWLGRWRGVSVAAPERADGYPTVQTLRTRWETAERDFRAFVESQGDAELERVVDYRANDGQPYRSALWHMIQHVVNHGTHHRSEVATMLTRLGQAPLATDLILYYRSAGG